MTFCPNCGKTVKKVEKFCANCGENLKEFLEDAEEEAEEEVRKTSHKGLVLFIVLLIIIGYVVLDIWAMTQITPEISVNSFIKSASNFKGSTGLSSASASTTFRFQNPTFVPVFLFPISYEAGYSSIQVLKGSTGMIFIPSYSSDDIPANIEISYSGGLTAIISGISNAITGNKQHEYVRFYELGIKFKEILS